MANSQPDVQIIPTNLIDISKYLYDRAEEEYTDDPSLFSLARSIEKTKMLIHPVLVTPTNDGRYVLLVGKRRLGAIRILEKKYADTPNNPYAVIRATVADLEQEHSMLLAIDENSERKRISRIGSLSIQFATIAFYAHAVLPEDDENTVVNKGITIALFYYYKKSFTEVRKDHIAKLPCKQDTAIISVDRFLEATGGNIKALVKKAKFLEMPHEFFDAVVMKWVTQQNIFAFYKKFKKDPTSIDMLTSLIKEIKKGKAQVSSPDAVERIIAFLSERFEQNEAKKILPKREYNSIKKQQDDLLKLVSSLDKNNPRLKLVKEHLSSAIEILKGKKID